MPGDLELRADLVPDIDPAFLRARTSGRLIYSLRSQNAGGNFSGGAQERARRLLAALDHYEMVDLEVDRDLTPDLLARIPPHRRRLSWHGRTRDLGGLVAEFGRMSMTPAELYLLAPVAESAEQAMIPLQLLKQLRRADVTAFATAPAGIWSRLLAPRLGAPVVFGRVYANGDSVPTVEQLLGDYRFPAMSPLKALFGIVGRQLAMSVSPRLHNDAYRALGLPALYLPIPVDDFTAFWRDVRNGLGDLGFSLEGVCVISPFKETALRLADTASGMARFSGAANLLVRRSDGWLAHSTDPVGIIGALRRAGISVKGRRAAVIGCGGAGRGAAAALMRAGLRPVLVNRSAERGLYAADLLGLSYVPLAEFAPEDYSLIVHATPIRDRTVFPIRRVTKEAVLVDMRYGPTDTALVAEARRRRLVVIDGWAVLMVESARQFRMMTGRAMPIPHGARWDIPASQPATT